MSKIEWIGNTGKTWNPVAGCFMVHDGCKNCYALTMSARLQLIGQEKYKGTTERLVLLDDGTTEWRADWETFDKERWQSKPRWSRKFKPWPAHLSKPLGWKSPRSIFVNSMSDLFGEGVPDQYIAAVFAVMAATPQHRYVILTKRRRAVAWFAWIEQMQDRAREVFGRDTDAYRREHILLGSYHRVIGRALRHQGKTKRPSSTGPWPLPNVAIGVSVSDQDSADEFLPLLAQIPTVAPVVSVEPMLGPVDLRGAIEGNVIARSQGAIKRGIYPFWKRSPLAQIIIGAESGPAARPVQIEWVRDLARQVLGVQVWQPCPDVECSVGALIDCQICGNTTNVQIGPSLFIKQWPVCVACHGDSQGARRWSCYDVNERGKVLCDNGQSRPAMTRKREADKTPRLHVPGYVLSNWTQPIRWSS